MHASMRRTARHSPPQLRRLLAAAGAVALGASLAFAAPGPGPGEPFGGDDSGCVPLRSGARRCSDTAARAFAALETTLNKCHVSLASTRFSQVLLGSTKTFDEEVCEAAALSRFDDVLAGLDSTDCSAVLTSMPPASLLLQTTLDARGAGVYCDAASGVLLDAGGDDDGYVPATRDAVACTKRVTIALGKLTKGVVRCHQQAAADGFAASDPPFDEEGCEQAAEDKYATTASRLLAKGTCPSCLDAPALTSLGEDTASRLDAGNDALFPCPDPVLHLAAPVLDRPTLMALGVQLPIGGDENRNAAVSVRYRVAGAPAWNEAMPLMRVKPETVAAGSPPIAEQFAGSILDLRPATSYEIELHATDADGPVDETVTINGTTRAVPADPVAPLAVAVSDASGLSAALAAAAPGHVITLADGVYTGAFVLDASGTAEDPIVIRGSSRDGTILDGDDCLCNVLEVYGSYVHVETLTLRNAQRALRFQSGGAAGNVVRRVHTIDTRLGIGTRDTQYDFYLCDNVLEGRLQWPHVYTDDGGIHANDDGILVQGHGHVVCHNQLVGFGDALKTELAGARSVDFYGNEVLSAYDNGIELDLGEGNLRAWRNRFTNMFSAISVQPVFGGPAYVLRNVVVNIADEQMKFHGLGAADGPSGVLAFHNTFVSPGIALQVHTEAVSQNFEVRNNLFVAPAVLSGTRTVDWTGGIRGGTFDGNGYYPDGGFRFHFPPDDLVTYESFAAMQSAGMETSGMLLTAPIFESGLVAPASYVQELAPSDATLDAASNAIDAGAPLAGVTNGFLGAAPDLGALERGCPLPVYGVRPAGVDERNEPVGCE